MKNIKPDLNKQQLEISYALEWAFSDYNGNNYSQNNPCIKCDQILVGLFFFFWYILY